MLDVLLTGSAGRIGRTLVAPFAERFRLRTLDREEDPASPEHVRAQLGDLPALRAAMQGIDVVVHLAAQPTEAAFVETLVPDNVVGAYHAYQAAVEAGVRRLVFASTCQTMMAYPREETVHVADPVRPSTLYGATKVFGEVLGRWFHDHHGLEVLCIRIGAFVPADRPRSERMARSRSTRTLFLAEEDAVEIFLRAVERPGIGYECIFASSLTPVEFLDREPARRVLDFEPRISAEERYGPLVEPEAGATS